MPPTNNGSTKDVQPLVVQIETLIPNSEPIVEPVAESVEAPVSASKPNSKPSIPYPSRLHDQKLRDKANDQKEKFFQIFKDLDFNINFTDALILMPKFGPTIKSLLTNKEKLYELARTSLNEHCSATGRALINVYAGELTLRVNNETMTFNLDQTSRYSAKYNDMTAKRIDVIDMACKAYSQEVLDFFDVIASRNPTLYYDPIVSTSSPTLTPFGDSDFFLEEVDAFLALEDDPTSSEVDHSYCDTEGDILLLEAFLNDDPSLPLPTQGMYLPHIRKELKIYKAKNDKSSIDEPFEVELKDLPPHLEYAFLEGDDKFPAIIVTNLSVDEKSALIKVLKSHKRAIAWKLSDIKGINPEFCTLKILMGDDFKPAVQHQRRVNPKIHDVIKKEGGFTVVENEENELIPVRLLTGWRVCIDYRKLHKATRKDHFPLHFIDQMLERLAGNEYYCLLDGFSGYFQIPIDPKDQEKTTFTCPYGTFAYRRMPFGMCNASGTFQRCIMAIFHDMIEKKMEVFMEDFSVFGNSFQTCLSYLEKMLKRCENTNHCLNWEKSHFIVKEGIVLGHKISKNEIEVDKTKVDVIAKLPHPTTVKGVWSFLSHAGFYRRFIKDFSRISRPITHLLEKNTPFIFSDECIDFMGSFLSSRGNKYILVAVDYLSKWVEAKALPINDARAVCKFLKSLFARFGTPNAIIIDRVQLNELNELRDQAYENSLIYKEKTKRIHDSKIKDRVFNVGDRVLLFNSRLKIFSGKLKNRWSRPFTITQVFPYGTVELSQIDGPNFKVNGHRLKHYFGEDIAKMIVSDIQTFPKDQ
uniref:Reverse transcriptase domain-containing protein n=1 Tax=Tanacetum cinerariifolium TaxID=118510 RepID=A0A6L2L506_TANCI|nr:reverse transcriptase domain-containing protein [Tanacetum cinerariifolium]